MNVSSFKERKKERKKEGKKEITTIHESACNCQNNYFGLYTSLLNVIRALISIQHS